MPRSMKFFFSIIIATSLLSWFFYYYSTANSIDPKYFSKPSEAITIQSMSPTDQPTSRPPLGQQSALKPSARLSQQVSRFLVNWFCFY